MVNTLKNISAFVLVAFLLLGVLFGMQIMTFIFGSLGVSSATSLDPTQITATGLTEVFINTTGFTIPDASNASFLGSFAVTGALNSTSGNTILVGNYTVDSDAGTITNATTTVWDNVTLNYTYNQKSDVRLATETTTNNSLQGVVTYSGNSTTQLNTVAIAITLLILIALFLIFWKAFISPMMKNNSGGKFS